MKTIGYIRVSTDKQDMSMGVQEEKIRAMAALQDRQVDEILTDFAQSAASLKRPAIQQLIEMCRARQVKTVIIAKLDRLTRSVRDLAELVELFNDYDISLVSVAETLDTGSAAGRMMMNVLVTVAQWEREVIGERTHDVLLAKRKRGERTGTVPYGYSACGQTLHLNEAEQAIIKRMKELQASGKSLRDIATALNWEGYATRRGTAWQFQYVARVLNWRRQCAP